MASKKFMTVSADGSTTILDLGAMEIWDGADMALLRDSLTRLIITEKHRSIGIDMAYVKYIPSGFFGMLFDWYETGVQILLYSPQPNVRRMLWFSRFFEAVSENAFQLCPQAIVDEFPVSCASSDQNGHSVRLNVSNGRNGQSSRIRVADSSPSPDAPVAPALRRKHHEDKQLVAPAAR